MARLLAFTVKRVVSAAVVLYIIITVVFFLAHLSPYDPIRNILGLHATTANVKALRHLYGLDRPLYQQYFSYLGGLMHGNFGYSEEAGSLGVPVWTIIQTGVPVTLTLGAYALVLALLVGLPVGLISALRQNSVIDHGSQSVMILLYVIPSFVFIPLCQLIFGAHLRLLPVTGWGDTGWRLGVLPNGGPGLQSSAKEMVLPVVIFAAGLAGFFSKSFRSFLLEVLRQDYIRTARSKGLKNRVVIYTHAVKNTLLPLASIVGPTVAYLIVGSFIIEYFFAIPGVAYITAESVIASDYSVIEGTTIILAAFVILVNMLTDIFYAIIDPRVRL